MIPLGLRAILFRTFHYGTRCIWPRIKKFHKMKYTFHPHFCSTFQGPRLVWPKLTDLVSCWLFWPDLAISAIFGQNSLELWNLEQKWEWKVHFILWHFLIWSQITELLTFLVLRLKCTVTLLKLRKHPIFFFSINLKYPKLKKNGLSIPGIFF